MIKVMAVNAGSSSLKYKLYEMPEEEVICSGIVERIGHDDGIFTLKYNNEKYSLTLPIKNHSQGVELVLNALKEKGIVKDLNEIKGVGHRVVQGGKYFAKSEIITDYVIDKIKELIPLDPLHAPAHLIGYEAFKKALPNAIAVATFDTAFHQSMEEEDYLFPIPYQLTEKYDCRRYGAHGTSHNYLALKGIKDYLGDKKETKIITCHIGSGASLCAIKNGKSIATSMGLTPLGGVMMGTRCGDIDPSVVSYICKCTSKSVEEVYDLLNKQSGILGVSNVSNDTRDVEEKALKGDKRSITAINLYARRIADFIGQYYVRLEGCDLIIFSAGVGENSPYYRKEVLKRIEKALNLKIDYQKNELIRGTQGEISCKDSQIKVVVIPTDEEVMIARDIYQYYKSENGD